MCFLQLLWRSDKDIKHLFNYSTTAPFYQKVHICRHIITLKNARLCSVHFISQRICTILTKRPTFYNASEPSFTPLHTHKLCMLEQSSTHEVLKNQRAKKMLPKHSEARLIMVCDLLICFGETISPTSVRRNVSPWHHCLPHREMVSLLQQRISQTKPGKCWHLLHFLSAALPKMHIMIKFIMCFPGWDPGAPCPAESL